MSSARLVQLAVWLVVVAVAGYMAYDIRIYAIKNYGRVIHEFDPWFNMRATQYLADNGWQKFFKWYDYMSWYPLGRPVGTTIYPGMQFSSVAIWNFLKALGKSYEMSLNDVCVFVPCWFGVAATFFTGLMTTECSGSLTAGAISTLIMAIVPAHFMRSVGGGYDNESGTCDSYVCFCVCAHMHVKNKRNSQRANVHRSSNQIDSFVVAMTAMCMTFYCWVRSLRQDSNITDGSATTSSYVWGVLTGLAYVYMVAAWGGFVFVLNLVALHAGLLALVGRYSSKLHRAYTLFYVIGTLGAIQVPVVGWSPFKSMEQLGGLVVFVALQLLEYVEVQRRKKDLSLLQVFKLRVKVFTPVAVLCAVAIAVLLPTGYFGPLTARVRGLST
jgi:dolichyl-diphosphooligosaccharide--protein glycosyltransferase